MADYIGKSPSIVLRINDHEQRIKIRSLDHFLAARKFDAKAMARSVADMAGLKAVPISPKIEIIPVAGQSVSQRIQQKIKDANTAINDIWQGTIGRAVTINRKKRKQEDETIMLLFIRGLK